MAVKNHALDDKIIAAARSEFLEKGYRNASLHQIAARAGTTTGALYTRYENKDALFCSLVQDLLEMTGSHMEDNCRNYDQARETGDPRLLLKAIRSEELVYRELLEEHMDSCILFFCRSDGSSLEKLLRQLTARKAEETVAYFKSISHADLDLDGVSALITGQFYFFRQVLEKGYDREKTLACIETVELYMEAGWEALFRAIL